MQTLLQLVKNQKALPFIALTSLLVVAAVMSSKQSTPTEVVSPWQKEFGESLDTDVIFARSSMGGLSAASATPAAQYEDDRGCETIETGQDKTSQYCTKRVVSTYDTDIFEELNHNARTEGMTLIAHIGSAYSPEQITMTDDGSANRYVKRTEQGTVCVDITRYTTAAGLVGTRMVVASGDDEACQTDPLT